MAAKETIGIETLKRRITIQFIEDVLGPLPKNKDIYKTWIESKKPESETEDESKNVPEGDNADELKGWTGFLKDDKGLFVYSYVPKGMLKYAASVLAKDLDVKQLKSKIIRNLFITDRKIHFRNNGEVVTKPGPYLERGLQVMLATGPRNTLMRSDSIPAGSTLTFTIEYIKKSPITAKIIATLLEYGKFNGLCQWRTGGYGSFEVIENVEIE